MKGLNVICVIILSIFVINTTCYNKYSKEANLETNDVNKNKDDVDEPVDLRPITLKHLDRPFRMAKLNLLWSKAVLRLSDTKLKSIFGDLKLHDKEEITWKHLRAEGKDKDGTMEAQLRKKLLQIMENFGLLDQADDISDVEKAKRWKPLNEVSDKHINKSIFKDKKLNKLWEKAEKAGFTTEELLALREEFGHHQDKIDQYYSLLHDVKGQPEDYEGNAVEDSLDKYNKIEIQEEKEPNKDYLDKVNLLRDKHKEINDGFDHLHLLSAKGPASKEFVEPKVQGLWKVALESNFTPSELHSLKTELLHYENRLLKLRHLQVEHALNEEKLKEKQKIGIAGGKTDTHSLMADNIKKHARKVEKIHLDIETRIMQKHIEL
ncbi:alpha-2-macroglobulin receptor-associated protein [Diabrotica undecimpunctata]|uniref:alpha-2-macroglobulin receptor-associated protein n=1 Tax=Diabrotica undecimpunctata TaxID=50387 RepID=UPI003B641155